MQEINYTSDDQFKNSPLVKAIHNYDNLYELIILLCSNNINNDTYEKLKEQIKNLPTGPKLIKCKNKKLMLKIVHLYKVNFNLDTQESQQCFLEFATFINVSINSKPDQQIIDNVKKRAKANAMLFKATNAHEVEAAINDGAYVNALSNIDGYTPSYFAAENNNYEVVKNLLENNAIIQSLKCFEYTRSCEFNFAVKHNNLKMALLLLNRKPVKSIWHVLSCYINSKNSDMLYLLLSNRIEASYFNFKSRELIITGIKELLNAQVVNSPSQETLEICAMNDRAQIYKIFPKIFLLLQTMNGVYSIFYDAVPNNSTIQMMRLAIEAVNFIPIFNNSKHPTIFNPYQYYIQFTISSACLAAPILRGNNISMVLTGISCVSALLAIFDSRKENVYIDKVEQIQLSL